MAKDVGGGGDGDGGGNGDVARLMCTATTNKQISITHKVENLPHL